ncbi:hypothetical protein EJ110_NYTH35765 [Nymphaea thermarum]|nr:hypothetical protein EJ110_NYTH35765 [Nymphaea thermarum]
MPGKGGPPKHQNRSWEANCVHTRRSPVYASAARTKLNGNEACAKERKVCAKCCCHVEQIVGRDVDDEAAERKELEEAIKNARERDRRTLLRAMNKSEKEVPLKPSNAAAGKQSFQSSRIDEHDGGCYSETSEDNEDNDNELAKLSIAADKQASQCDNTDDDDDSSNNNDDEDEDDECVDINDSDEKNDDDPCH